MMFTSPMRLLAAVALDKDSDAIAEGLLRLGVLDIVSIRDFSGEWKSRVSAVEPRVNMARLGELRKRVEGFMDMASPPIPRPDLSAMAMSAVDLADAERRLDAMAAEINGMRERQKSLQDEVLKLQEIRRQVDSFDDLGSGAAASSTYSFLSIRAGTLLLARIPELETALSGLPSVLLPSESQDGQSAGLVLVTLKRDDARVAPLLDSLGWEDAKLPDDARRGKEETLRELDAKVDALRGKQSSCSADLRALLEAKGGELSTLWAGLRLNELVARVRSGFSKTDRTVLFSGWIPAEKQEAVERGIRSAASGGCSLEWIEPGRGEARGLDVPVEMENPRLLQPFEGLVRNYAVPEYGAVDPTPFVAVAYLCMFGLMFGDAGHGLVVALAGLAARWLARKKGRQPKSLYTLMVYCGLAAMVTGALFGSYFGMELFPALWFDYHGIVNGREGEGNIRSVYDILGITIKFGMAVLAAGFVINWINLARKRDWLTLLLDKAGLLGGWIYGAGAWAAFYFVGHDYKGLPPAPFLVGALAAPTLILALKGPVEFALHGRREGKRFKAGMVMDFFMEWIVEVLEIYSGYLANTLSFMRVAGLGIAHVSLMTAFFQIARMITPEGPFSLPAVLVLILGNALVIALEGLSAGIQSLRLNYYEFFSKYFNGTGKAYRPISLRE